MKHAIRAHVAELEERRELWDRFPVGIAIWNLAGELLFANATLLGWVGQPREVVTGTTMDELARLYPPCDFGFKGWDSVRTGAYDCPQLTQIPTRGGSLFLESHMLACYDWRREFTGAFQIVLDRTHRSMVERNARLAVTGELAAAVAHEMKNHLTVTYSYLELVERFLDGRGQPHLRHVRRHLNALSDHAQRLLAPGRKVFPEVENVALEQVLLSAVATVMPQATARNVSIELSMPQQSIEVRAHAFRLEQVFVNLLLNAVEASRSGDAVMIAVTEDDESVSVDVRDQGPGMEPDVLCRLGEPFFTTKDGGSGLGVYICREILGDYGGSLAYRSDPGRGTEARVSLARTGGRRPLYLASQRSRGGA